MAVRTLSPEIPEVAEIFRMVTEALAGSTAVVEGAAGASTGACALGGLGATTTAGIASTTAGRGEAGSTAAGPGSGSLTGAATGAWVGAAGSDVRRGAGAAEGALRERGSAVRVVAARGESSVTAG